MKTIKESILTDDKILANVEFLEKIADFCEENNLPVKFHNETDYFLIFRVSIGDKLWNVLKNLLKSDPRYYQQHKSSRPNLFDSEIRVRHDRPGNILPRVGISYNWEGGHADLAKTNPSLFGNFVEIDGTMELRIETGRAFMGNKNYHDRIVNLIYKMCPDMKYR